ncbi:SurA N-terminal domain-containing protein [Candidatus Omnitrophota bacterium]
MRQKDLKKVLWAMVIVIVPAFMLFGANSFVKGRANFAGMIYGRKISNDEYQTFLRNIQVLFLLGSGKQFTDEMPPEQLTGYAWQNLLFIEKAKRENISVSDTELAARIRNLAFLNAQGGFSEQKYLAVLDNLRVVPGQFEQFIKNMIRSEKLTSMILMDVGVNEDEIHQAYTWMNEEAKIKYVFVDIEGAEGDFNPPREELEAFFNTNTGDFRIGAKVKIAYLLIEESASSLVADISGQIEERTGLEEIAANLELELKQSDFFGQNEPIESLGWQDEIAKIAFAIGADQVAGPLAIAEGTVFFKKIDYKDSYLPQFSEVADKVKEALITERAEAKAAEKAQELTATIAEKKLSDLNDLKKTFSDLEVVESDFFKRRDYVEKIGLEPEFNQKVFSLEQGQILDQALKLKNGFCIVQLLEKKPIDEAKFSEEKESYRAQILQSRQMTRLNSYLQELVQESKLSVRQGQTKP